MLVLSRRPLRLCTALALICVISQVANADTPPRQDGRNIQRLEWRSPFGDTPTTYEEYLLTHPRVSAEFKGTQRHDPAGGTGRTATLAILTDSALAPNINAALNNYVANLNATGYTVMTDTVSGGTPADIKSWIQSQYAAGANGILLIGDITAAWAEVSGAVFPCELFYMDLDGSWDDPDGDGVYETHAPGTGDEGPELYVARLYAHTLTYAPEATLVNDYLAKVADYRTGALAQRWRGLEYVEEDWYDMYTALDQVYNTNVDRHDYGYLTTASGYLDHLAAHQHFTQVCAHSYPGGHHFGTRPTESVSYAHVYVNSPITRSAWLRVGSDDGVKVWVNGEVELTRDVYQGWTPDQFAAVITLNAGWNRVLCKVSQGGGDHQLSARFTDASHEPLADLQYQLDDPATNPPTAPYIRGWLVNGFHQDSSDNFYSYLTTNYLGVNEAGINPTEGSAHGGHVWTYQSAADAYVDLEDYSGGADFGVTYAFVRVLASETTPCELWLGYDDGVRAWLNGQVVAYDNRYGDYVPDMTKVPVTLNPGENRLLVKVSEWMGPHGMSARFCHPDGSAIQGLTCDPLPTAINYIGSWLVNGPYLNPDPATRLSEDYLAGEADVAPSTGDPAPNGTWQPYIGDAEPVDLGLYFDHGGWVYSSDIQDHDPPVLFYNLFACGAGLFTEQNYLGGAYIFNTTYGLCTIASTKSGSMLNFQDFTQPLSAGLTLGDAFLDWFETQAPFQQWEREWYYGMELFGDPTLRVVAEPHPGDLNCDGSIDFDDISPFVKALSGEEGYYVSFPNCDWRRGDCDGNGTVDFDDIAPFIGLLQ